MFRRFASLALTAPLAACVFASSSDGPTETREGVFQYVAQMAPGTTLHVRTARGAILVEPATDDTLRVTGDVSWSGGGEPLDDLDLTGSEVPSGVLICASFGNTTCTVDQYNAQFNDRARRRSVTFRIAVPQGVKLEMVGISADIRSASTAPVEARTVDGDVTVVTAVGPVRAETVNGDVDARMTSLSGTDSVIVKTINGDAWAFLPEQVGATIDAAVTNGDVVTDFPSLRSAAGSRSLRAALGNGATPVRVRTLNGDAGVRRLDAMGRAFDAP